MAALTEAETTALSRSRTTKRLNAVTAILSGGVPAIVLALAVLRQPDIFLLGLFTGLVWANAFEYVYHRFLLHRPSSSFAQYHQQHHAVTGTPAETERVTFGESPLWVVLLFAVNEAPILIVDLLWKFGIAPGVFVAFSVYYVTLEEIHWRIHLGTWLPPFLHPARTYHLAHHDRPDRRFNVFLPGFDWLCGTGGR